MSPRLHLNFNCTLSIYPEFHRPNKTVSGILTKLYLIFRKGDEFYVGLHNLETILKSWQSITIYSQYLHNGDYKIWMNQLLT